MTRRRRYTVIGWMLEGLLRCGWTEAGTVQGCVDASDCQYAACTTRSGYTGTQVKCALDDWFSEYGLNCRQSRTYTSWGVTETVWDACTPGPCPAGKYKAVADVRDSCVLCPTGKYMSESTSDDGCITCEVGTYASTQGSTECTSCAAGSYQASTGQSSCETCAAGYAQAREGQSDCGYCQPGQYQPQTGQTRCLSCALGTYSAKLAVTLSQPCVQCTAGSYASAAGAGACQTCQTKPSSRWFYTRLCTYTQPATWDECRSCSNQAAPCTNNADTRCGAIPCTAALLAQQPDYSEWLTAEYKCRPGQYLRGFNTTEDKDCRPCPSGMVGLDGVKCEWCAGPLEEPYWLDQSSCVCKAPAVMNRTGGCECPDGWRFNETASECEACPINTYGRQGRCYDCGAGNFSAAGATECAQCVYGKYRLQGDKECRSCANATQFYAPNAWSDECVGCNRSCDGLPGWRDNGPCPSGIAGYRVCAPCEIQLPNHSTWVAPGGGCVYKCDPGYYFNEWDSGACKPCSTAPCPPGLKGTACTDYADRACDNECVNTSKPTFHSVWAEAGPAAASPCPWVCEDGYEAVETDYWMFQLHECVPVYDAGEAYA